MGKSIRSKVKRKFRAIKVQNNRPAEKQRRIATLGRMPDAIRPDNIPYQPRSDPLDPRASVPAWRLAFPTHSETADKQKEVLDEAVKKLNFRRKDEIERERQLKLERERTRMDADEAEEKRGLADMDFDSGVSAKKKRVPRKKAKTSGGRYPQRKHFRRK